VIAVKRKLRCPRCGGEPFQVHEVWTGAGMVWDYEGDKLSTEGHMTDEGRAHKVRAECAASDCGHIWTVRGAISITDIADV
jgi:hypothetical protein